MQFIKVAWIHDLEDEPIVIYSELDDARNEVRKIELYRNGRVGYASATIEHNGSRLSEVPLPQLEQIRADTQFEPTLIGADEFERAWSEFCVPSGHIDI